MRALLRFIPAGARKWVVVGLALLIVAGILARLFGGSSSNVSRILVPALVALLVIAAAWILIHFLTRAARKRKQRTFDASLAAKEGIEDRKREWQSWVQELEKADIDRYELPFYLLLGEPQSGKSILLQNSDLNFLFGQNRLSGVGGTRGCDWWFTHEAVILDLAGRLFTHEGGAADEAEWEAFLDLLNSFRPMDPANGIMLVIPCDSLLSDSLETSRKKASQIREALFMLTRKLEAKLPIYVILTKGDKIFGFAESVHRLEAEQRKQMFGWSRPLDRLEHPFQSEELGEAWDGFVANASSLRDSMLATARIPEALPEVDRMMAFPSELRGMYLAVEAYMTRIFQGSDLLDQLYFRGIYLTSGLQSGAPIAKVGLEILDRPGDADNRDLETLFVRQQAYFIRDLVRSRVFAERGLVRPTGARTKRVQKNAWVGYGVAAGFAVLAAGYFALAFVKSGKQERLDVYTAAISEGKYLTSDEGRQELSGMTTQDDVLAVLERLKVPKNAIKKSTEEDSAFASTGRFYESRTTELVALDDVLSKTFAPKLQDAAARALKTQFQLAPAEMTASIFVHRARAAEILLAGFQDQPQAAHLLDVLPEGGTSEVAIQEVLKTTLGDEASAPACGDLSLKEAVGLINKEWQNLTTSSSALCFEEPLQTFVAMFEIEQERSKIGRWVIDDVEREELTLVCSGLTQSLGVLRTLNKAASERDKTKDVQRVAEFLENDYARIKGIRDTLRDGETAEENTRLDEFRAFVQRKMPSLRPDTGAVVDLDTARSQLMDVRDEVAKLISEKELLAIIKPEWGVYSSDTQISALQDSLKSAAAACAAPTDSDETATPMEVMIARVKTRYLASDFVQLTRDWPSFTSHSGPATEPAHAHWIELSNKLRATNLPVQDLSELPDADRMGIANLSEHVRKLAKEGLEAGHRLLAGDSSEVATDLVKAVLVHRQGFTTSFSTGSTDPIVTHVGAVFGVAKEKWAGHESDEVNQSGAIAKWTLAHLEALDSLREPASSALDVTALNEHSVLVETWAHEVIDSELDTRFFNGCRELARKRAAELAGSPIDSWVDEALTTLTGSTDDTGVFDNWLRIAVDSKGLDPVSLESLSKLAARSTGSTSSVLPLKDTVRDVGRLTERTRSRDEAGLVDTLRKELRTIDGIKTPSERAAALLALAQEDEIKVYSMESAFADELRSQIILNQKKVLREAYFKLLASEVVDEERDLLTLWGTVKDPEAGKQLAALNSIFGDPGGWYPKNFSSFRLGTLKRLKMDFRAQLSGDGSLDKTAKKLRKLDTFLEELARYLHGPEGDVLTTATGEEVPLFMSSKGDERYSFQITPSKQVLAADLGGWREFGGFDSILLVERLQSIEPGSSKIFETRPIDEWSYGITSEIDMTLNPAIRSERTKQIKWRTTSPLAPLHFWWQGGNGDGLGIQGKDWASFVLVVDKKEDIRVEFTITFVGSSPPPKRPKRRETPLPTN